MKKLLFRIPGASLFNAFIPQQRHRHHRLPNRAQQQRKRRINRPHCKRTSKASRRQHHQEHHPPVPQPVTQLQQPRINHNIHIRRRGHGRRDLRDLQPPTHRHLRPRRKRQTRNHPQRGGAFWLYWHGILHNHPDEDQECLDDAAKQQPESAPHPEPVPQLAHDQSPQDKHAQAHADVGEAVGVVCEAGDADREEQRVAGLVGGEAGVVGPCGGVLDAGCEGEEEELAFQEEVFADVLV
ncbi:uncharacterized protein DSM5745_00809 [Aspergillus mulundensis]|uniref:Uncharacterized protein n=1 Tax=Aspergillus mulundensis TaxID=1810919 RepID=A0A3D8T4J0_9EURO|nr:hypothetical protein DSM5745_00809 [Aspergillus mulundensis]RDW93487.1 hypothetical protein DSM5745_00809 [Aspergillus mulundensis]